MREGRNSNVVQEGINSNVMQGREDDRGVVQEGVDGREKDGVQVGVHNSEE